MDLMTIGAFAERTRLSPKALRLYDRLGLLRRSLLSISRHLHAAETGAFFDEAFTRLRSAGPGVEGIAGAPFLVFYGESATTATGRSN
jgi:MerR family regulatory protein